MSLDKFKDAAKHYFAKYDANNDNEIGFRDFTSLYVTVQPDSPLKHASNSEWQNIFAIYDVDGSDSVSWSEFWMFA